ncbi:MAG: hypothetical protein J6A52_04430 [Bacilli bacterium]|nr:hypothetical protein [Bacilli bacterium]
MSFNYTKIDIVAVEAALEKWNTAVSSFENNELKIKNESFFQMLKDANLDDGFIESYYNNNEALKKSLKSSSKTILTTLQHMDELDQSVRDDIANLLADKPKRNPGDDTQDTDDPDKPKNPDNPDSPSDTPPELIDNSEEQLAMYANMSMSDLANVAAEISKLSDLNNTTFDDVLSNEEYMLKIHGALLASPNLSDELKMLIEAGDTSISQKLLANIFSGRVPSVIGFNDDMKNVLNSYLGMVANSNNISINQLLMDPNYTKLLKTSLSNFNNVGSYVSGLNDTNIVDSLFDVYDGNETGDMGSAEVSIIRSFVECTANSTNVSVEEMLSNTSNMPTIQTGVMNLGKTSVFMDSLTKFSDGVANNILSSLIGIKTQGE